MQATRITTIPVYNGEKFIRQTLESVARQTLPPDRLIVIDNCSTDATEQIVKGFQPIKCEWIRNPKNLGLFGNCNRALEFASETQYLHLLCADDLIEPDFYKLLIPQLQPAQGFGLAYCLDERIDENDRRLSISGKADGSMVEIPVDTFVTRKSDTANQAFSGTMM